jgi:NAD(P)-dependent dehydrogenase (short-subunit alcohol dehydrogenase family)
MFDNLAGERGQPAASYAQSMFANALYAKELSRRLQVRGITVNAVNPGQVRGMGLGKPLGLVRRLAQIAALPFQRTPAQGAATIALLAASPDAAGITGEYWQDCAIAPGNPLLDDAAMSVRLWETSEAILAVHASRSQRLARAA